MDDMVETIGGYPHSARNHVLRPQCPVELYPHSMNCLAVCMNTGIEENEGMKSELKAESARASKQYSDFVTKRRKSATCCLVFALKVMGITTPQLLPPYRGWERDGFVQVLGAERSSRLPLKKKYGAACYYMNIPMITIEPIKGVYCTDPVCTWFMLAQYVELDQLVALGDNILGRQNMLEKMYLHYRLCDFEDYIAQVREWSESADSGRKRAPRGIEKCEMAVVLMRERVDSPMETKVRLEVIIAHDLPEPKINYVLTLPSGRTVYLDMAYPEWKICVEYDGKQHAKTWEEDAQRRNEIEAAGWGYVQVTADDMRTRESKLECARRIAARIEERTHKPVLLFEEGYLIEEVAAMMAGKPLPPRKRRRRE